MKKSISAIIIAAFVALSVVCAFAAQAEEPSIGASGEVEPDESAVVYNFLAALTDTDGSYYTVENNKNGSVTVTLKQEASQEAPIILATYPDAKIDLSQPAYFAADFVSESADMDFRLHYTRKDYEDTEKNGIADLYFTGMKKASDYTKSSTDTSIVWDFAAYVSGAKRYENNIHEIKNLAITAGSAGDSITFNTLAMVSDAAAMVVGTPLVAPATAPEETTSEETTTEETTSETTSDETSPEETTSEETTSVEETTSAVTSSDETTPEATSSETTSSVGPTSSASESTPSSPITGDAGVILYVVLAVLAAAGAIAMVRLRKE